MRTIHKGSLAAAAAIAGSAVALVSAATPAFAAQSITNPSTNPFSVPEVTTGTQAGTPLTFEVQGSGYVNGSGQTLGSVFIEICDGTPSTTPGWDPTVNCDLGTSPSPQIAATGTGNVTYAATNGGNSIVDFRGQSPQALFNCVAAEDIPAGTPQNPDGSYDLDGVNGGNTANGEPIAQGVESWTNCQLRMSTSNQNVTSDQQFLTLTIPDTPVQTPETPMAILLPIGAIGLLGGGLLIARRRRRSPHAAAA